MSHDILYPGMCSVDIKKLFWCFGGGDFDKCQLDPIVMLFVCFFQFSVLAKFVSGCSIASWEMSF